MMSRTILRQPRKNYIPIFKTDKSVNETMEISYMLRALIKPEDHSNKRIKGSEEQRFKG